MIWRKALRFWRNATKTLQKFKVVNPAFRGKGIAKEMLKAASD